MRKSEEISWTSPTLSTIHMIPILNVGAPPPPPPPPHTHTQRHTQQPEHPRLIMIPLMPSSPRPTYIQEHKNTPQSSQSHLLCSAECPLRVRTNQKSWLGCLASRACGQRTTVAFR